MAQAGALLGLVVPDVELDDIGCTSKTMPEFADLWLAMVEASDPEAGFRRGRFLVSAAQARDEHGGVRPARPPQPAPDQGPSGLLRRREGMVVTVDRGRFTALVDGPDGDGHQGPPARPHGGHRRRPGAAGRRHLRRAEGTLARIVEVAERDTVLRRTADDDDPYERPIVANADQLVIVTALADPPPRTGMIDRILVAGFDAGIAPLLCLTKADLASPDDLIAQYAPLGCADRGHLPRRRPGPAAGSPGRASQRVRRALRGRQVDLGQCADPGGAAGDRRGQRGDRARPAHLVLGHRAAAPRSLLNRG